MLGPRGWLRFFPTFAVRALEGGVISSPGNFTAGHRKRIWLSMNKNRSMSASCSALMLSRSLAGSRASVFSTPPLESISCSFTSLTHALLVNGFAEPLTGMAALRIKPINTVPNRINIAATVSAHIFDEGILRLKCANLSFQLVYCQPIFGANTQENHDFVYTEIIPQKSSALRLAPPTSAPFTFSTAINSAAFPGLTDPP